MKVEIWSDFACPFCYIGEKKLEKAIQELELEDGVEVEFKSFQLNVNAVSHPDKDINQLIAEKYGISYEQAKANNDRIIDSAKSVGLSYDFDNIKPGNTGLAHQAVKLAKEKGLENELVNRYFKAYFEEGYDLGEIDNVIDLAEGIGIDREELSHALANKSYELDVLGDQNVAGQIGVQSVPFFVFDSKYAVSGAQDVEQFKMVMQKVIEEK